MRNYRKEYDSYHSQPSQRRRRSSRNKARRKMAANGAKLLGRDVDHRDGNPMNNSRGNLRTLSVARNRGRR